MKYIFLHELVHHKRKDIAVNWAMTVLLIMHWFNPVLWYAYRRSYPAMRKPSLTSVLMKRNTTLTVITRAYSSEHML
ncbi:MAG: hypothetical protein KID09_05430 [Paenibacillus macerans]|nr:hypothetical protein [Paenibacillus macerans]